MRDQGLKFFPAVNWVERGLNGDGNSVPGYHVIWGTGYRLVELFTDKLARHHNKGKLQSFYQHRVEEFYFRDSKVVGCRSTKVLNKQTVEFEAAHTIVACGGINGSIERVKENWYKPWGLPPKEMLNGSHPYADGALHES